MISNETIIDSVLVEFDRAAKPIRLDCRGDIIRLLPRYKSFWETCAADIAENFQPDRLQLLRCLRGRIDVDREMVLRTMSRLLEERYKDYLVASGESEDMATIVSSALVSLRIVL